MKWPSVKEMLPWYTPHSPARCIRSLSPLLQCWFPALKSSSPASWGSVSPTKWTHNINNCSNQTALQLQIEGNISGQRVAALATDVESGGYRQANQAAVQTVSGDYSKQGGKEHDQVSNKLQTDGQPSAHKRRKTWDFCTQKKTDVQY